MQETYPSRPEERNAWIQKRRAGVPRTPLNPRQAAGWLREAEPDVDGVLRSGLTVFLTNRECPWKCLMCDLWRQALPGRVRPGDVPFQLQEVFREAGVAETPPEWIKLYNAGSFFDSGALPRTDRVVMARRVEGIPRVIVENHPALTDRRILPFRDALDGARLEVAIGLETAHPAVLERLNKRVDLDGFRRAAGFLAAHGIDLRVFLLVRPPYLDESAALEWTCRSIDVAFECGAGVVTLIPTRLGNGALEELAAQGEFLPPCLATVQAALSYGLSRRRGRVFADLWELGKSVSDPENLDEYCPRLQAMNLGQSPCHDPASSHEII